jgi:polyhydroxyalkanoate synthesis regulator phasin
MSKTKTEVKLSKTLTILNSVQSENEDLKEEISELEKHITKLKAEGK